MCGLSKKKPFCDGSHKRAKDEEDGKLYLEAVLKIQTH
jgi:CDGSH-type Zn-finger protein